MFIKHLTAINDLSVDTIFSILEKSSFYSQNIDHPEKYQDKLKNKMIANIFFENSTRTKFSFEVAAKRLGAHVLNFSAGQSSVSKGETLYDTLKTFESLGVDTAIIRHSDDNYLNSIRDKFRFRIVNAGAGKFEHPSQSLLDLFTIYEEFKSFEGLTITICGDIASSRVAKSNINAFSKLGVKVHLCGPEMLLPSADKLPNNCELSELNSAIADSDAVMFLRVQHERHEAFEVSTNDYNDKYGLNNDRIALMKDKAIVMHPGPVNRDVEILSDLVEHSKSRIFKQMENGVYTRMAILDWLYS